MKKIQTGDMAIVTAGKFKGKQAKILAIHDERVVLQGVNVVKQAKKKQGFVEKEAAIHGSNVSLYDGKSKAGSRVRVEVQKGKKVRVYVKSGEVVKKA